MAPARDEDEQSRRVPRQFRLEVEDEAQFWEAFDEDRVAGTLPGAHAHLWILAIAGFSLFPYYVAIIETYDDFGVPSGDITAIVVFFVVTVYVRWPFAPVARFRRMRPRR